ncbi:PEP-CTERM sorting domain-containing protein [Thalassotalea castellviae]|uniref:PEP-CTERM sorting domain-containing protein n=1 Tax=Thalassotalea castellviae TaxID=3075612 RepID=A0ABU3A531_9GAMM|nr:PEP-CTERM sorting domain-containing protein [Thalassotalea sp. W431]MDT0605289.1 PEP-CTERM sorting domain-containing protein [Thalassotalea sp. W431]
MKYKFLKGLVTSFALAISCTSNAALIYGSDPISAGTPLTVFDTNTGTTTVLGSSLWNLGLAFDNSNSLFGINGTTVYSVDINNGSTSLIGSGLWQGSSESATFDLNNNLLSATSTGLYSINTSNAATTYLGAFVGHSSYDGISVATTNVETILGTFLAGTIFAVDSGQLYVIDPNTLVSTFLMSAPASETIAFDANGNLYANDYTNGYYLLDLVNQNHTFLGGSAHFGSAVYGAYSPQTDVPEPSTLAIFALGLIGLAFRKFNQKG